MSLGHSNIAHPLSQSKPNLLSHIARQWQVFMDHHKHPPKHHQNLDKYLQSNIQARQPGFSPKIKHIPFITIAKSKDKQANKLKQLMKNKKKTLFIEDFDDSEIRNSAHSLEMAKVKPIVSAHHSHTITPERISIHKLPQNKHNQHHLDQPQKRHQSLPNRNNDDDTILRNEYIVHILKKFQKKSQTREDQTFVPIIKTTIRPKFKRYSQQCPKMEPKSAFASKKYIGYHGSTKIRSRVHRKSNHSDVGYVKLSQKRSIQISPWQIPQQQS